MVGLCINIVVGVSKRRMEHSKSCERRDASNPARCAVYYPFSYPNHQRPYSWSTSRKPHAILNQAMHISHVAWGTASARPLRDMQAADIV